MPAPENLTPIERAIWERIASAGGAVSDAMAPNDRQLAAQADWRQRLSASRANPGVLEQMLMRLRGPQMPAAIPRGSLAEILNAQRVANPNPSMTPPPMIGMRN